MGTYRLTAHSFVAIRLFVRRSHRLYFWDPAEHLCFVNPCNFRTSYRFKRSWLATTADIWNGLPVDLILQGESSG